MKEAALLMVDALGMSQQWHPFRYDRKVQYGRSFRDCVVATEQEGNEGLVDGLLVSDTALLLFPNLPAAVRFGSRLFSKAIVTNSGPLVRVYLRGVIVCDSGARSVHVRDQRRTGSNITIRRIRHSVATSFILEKAGVRGMRLTFGFKNYPPSSSKEYEDDWAMQPDHLFPDHELNKVANKIIRLDDKLYPTEQARYGLNWDVDWPAELEKAGPLDHIAWNEALAGMIDEQVIPTRRLLDESRRDRNSPEGTT